MCGCVREREREREIQGNLKCGKSRYEVREINERKWRRMKERKSKIIKINFKNTYKKFNKKKEIEVQYRRKNW